jgi:DNA-3-methyladenine glycosylase I
MVVESVKEFSGWWERSEKELKKRGFTFVGSTICYAFMQAVGMVNDHIVECFRWQEVQALDQSSSLT